VYGDVKQKKEALHASSQSDPIRTRPAAGAIGAGVVRIRVAVTGSLTGALS